MKNILFSFLLLLFASYSIYSQPVNSWEGNTSSDWGNDLNWSLGHVPLSTEDVDISTGYTFAPKILDPGTYLAYCNNLLVGVGTTLTISNGELHVSGNTLITAELIMDHSNALLELNGNIGWPGGAMATISAPALIQVYGNWIFYVGADVEMNNGRVQFLGSNDQYITTKSANSWFCNIEINKTGGFVAHNVLSTNPLAVMDFELLNGEFRNDSDQDLIVYDDFYSNGTCDLNSGGVTFSGILQNIEFASPGYFNNLIISPAGGTVILDSPIDIHGNLLITSGNLNTMDYKINIRGNWFNVVGPDGFIEGNGRVVFDNPSGSSYLTTNETFNILEVNIAGELASILIGRVITCNEYDWTSGGIVIEKGTFTALDLTDDGLFGSYTCALDGEINLTQDPGGYVDLNCDITIASGGRINVYGGNDRSYWPYANDASITMTGGILDFKNQGINITGLHSLTDNISGGVIRTAREFTGSALGFTPTGGLIELYGTISANLSHGSGSNFHSVLIGKSGKDDLRAGAILAQSNLDINGTFTLNSGIFSANGNDIAVGNDWANYAGAGNFNETSAKVTFDGSEPSMILTDETFFDLSLNKSPPGTDYLEIDNGITVHVSNDLNIMDGLLEMDTNSRLNIDRNLEIANMAGLNAHGDTGINIQIKGDWMNYNTDYSLINGFSPGTSTVTFNGASGQTLTTDAPQEEFNNLVIDVDGEKFYPDDHIRVYGDFTLDNGWSDNVAGLSHYFQGDFSVMTNGYWVPGSGQTVVFEGTGYQELYMPPANGYFRNLTVDKSPPKSGVFSQPDIQKLINLNETDNERAIAHIKLLSNIDCNGGGDIVIDYGILKTYGRQLKTTGDININDGGVLALDENAVLTIENNKTLSVYDGGSIFIIGSAGNEVLVTHTTTGYYNFNIGSGGTISAQHAIFEYGGFNGVYVFSGAIVNDLYPFDYCTFRNGSDQVATGLLVISNDQDLTIYKANFPSSKRAATYNIVKENTLGEIMMLNATGVFSGETNEYDPNDMVDWSNPELLITPGHQDVLDTANVTSFTVTNAGTGLMNWTASVPTAYSSWLSITGGGTGINAGTIDLAFETNTGVARTGKVIVNAPFALNSPDTVEIRQEKAQYYIDVPSDTLGSAEATCIFAYRSITIPGDAGSYVLSNGSALILIAGDSIKLKDHFHAVEGSCFHAFISDVPCVVKSPSLVSIKPAEKDDQNQIFEVYPNPVRNNLNIDFIDKSTENPVYIEIYNSLGKPIFREELVGNHHLQINVKTLGSGLYFVKAFCGEKVYLKKFVKY